MAAQEIYKSSHAYLLSELWMLGIEISATGRVCESRVWRISDSAGQEFAPDFFGYVVDVPETVCKLPESCGLVRA